MWNKKYYPKNIDDLLNSKSIINFVKNIIKNNILPNCLFYGDYGTGKTSIALLLSNILLKNKKSRLIINFSFEKNIGNIEKKIINFIKFKTLDPFKIIIIDDIYNLKYDIQINFKKIIELYYKTVKFIFIFNNIDNIDEILSSYFCILNFKCLKINKVL